MICVGIIGAGNIVYKHPQVKLSDIFRQILEYIGAKRYMKIIDVFIAGEEGFGNYRIPSIIFTNNYSLLAFCEARTELNDHAQNKIVLKRSLDKGESWGDLQVLADAGINSLNNPLAVEIAETGRILLMYQFYPYTEITDVENPEKWISHSTQNFPPNVHEAIVKSGYEGDKICRTYLRYSDNDGISWSDAKEITRSVKHNTNVTNYASGPGIGIQIKMGRYKDRIVMPFSPGPWNQMKAYVVFSDDLGETWRMSDPIDSNVHGQANESQVVELADGGLMINSRSYKGAPYRLKATSQDGGKTWSEFQYDYKLSCPGCQGSILRLNFPDEMKKAALIFSNSAHKLKRMNGIIKISYDDGNSWQASSSVCKGFYGYSCLAALGLNEIGVLFERNEYASIGFKKMQL